MDRTHDGAGDPDAEPDAERGHQGEAGALPQGAERKAQILPHVLDDLPPADPLPAPGVDRDARLPNPLERAEPALRLFPRHTGRLAGGDEVALVHLEVEAQFGLHIFTNIRLPEPEEAAPAAGLGHRRAQPGWAVDLSTLVIASTKESQVVVSARSWCRHRWVS